MANTVDDEPSNSSDSIWIIITRRGYVAVFWGLRIPKTEIQFGIHHPLRVSAPGLEAPRFVASINVKKLRISVSGPYIYFKTVVF